MIKAMAVILNCVKTKCQNFWKLRCTLCPSWCDAKFQIVFILTKLTIFECHFYRSYYYLHNASAANFHKIHCIFSETTFN